jgi:ParB-like chromosome segregation protein Spo0J
MHADERNKAVSEQLGRDVYHYHLHVVYVPVVDKEIYFKKNNKDPEKAGKLREVIKQVSHSKKWPKLKQYDENGEVIRNEKGKAELINSYSLLQDHFHEHMREAGFLGFERGQYKSTRKHLDVLEFKAQQEAARAKAERAAVYAAIANEKQQTAATLDKDKAKKQKQLDKLDEAITVKGKAAATVAEVEAMGKPALLGSGFTVTADEMKTLKSLAKEGVKSRGIIAELKKQITGFVAKIKELTQKLTRYEGMGLTDTMKYYEALQRAPRRLAETVADIRRQPPERQEQQRTTPERKRSTGIEH